MNKKIFITIISVISIIQFTLAQVPRLKIGNNPTSINSSAALEISSSNGGLLISRMSSNDRDAISSPANGLLIFNTSNNSFEVYKNSCSCWVSIYDGGSNPANSEVDTPPWASNIQYSGQLKVGEEITTIYRYNDTQNDPEGATSFQWQFASTDAGIDAQNIPGATSLTFTPTAGYSGSYIRIAITPRSSFGILNGVQVFGTWVKIDGINAPSAESIDVDGTFNANSLLTTSYTFTGGSGVENTNPSTGSIFRWQTAQDNTGLNIATAPFEPNQTQFFNSYTPSINLLGRYIRFSIIPKDNTGLQSSNFINSAWYGPITNPLEAAPISTNVTYSPAPAINLNLVANYTYGDINMDPEGTSTFQWYRADDANGLNQVPISGETNQTYTIVSADANKYIGFGVTPIAQTGTLVGNEVIYYNSLPTAPIAEFTFTASPIKQLPFFTKNKIMNTLNQIQVEVNVSSPGGVVFNTNTVNGYSFSSNTIVTSGLNWVTLTANGTQSAYSSVGNNFTLTGIGVTTETKNITIKNTITGEDLTTFSNGATYNENFSSNGQCSTAAISTGHTAGSCSGSITVGSNTYDLILINGQCWTKQNMKEIPSAPCSSSPNSGCNVWNNNAMSTDVGMFGFYNTSVTNGSSGWGTSEPSNGEGFLYQWSAAMNNTTYERSRGLCPEGFHIPSDCEFKYLEHGIGMDITSQNQVGGSFRQNGNVGTTLKNSSGFNWKLSGGRNTSNGTFTDRNVYSFDWSSSTTGSEVWRRALVSTSGGSLRVSGGKNSAFSVRCIKD